MAAIKYENLNIQKNYENSDKKRLDDLLNIVNIELFKYGKLTGENSSLTKRLNNKAREIIN